MDRIINPAVWNRVFPVPCDITDRHIKMCSGVALKCLLLMLRRPDEFCSVEALAKKLGQPSGEIADALNYWEEQGVLSRLPEGGAAAFKAVSPGGPDGAAPSQGAAAALDAAPPPQKAPPPPSRPRFPRDEALAIVNGDGILRSLVDELQAVLGKPLTSADTDVLVALYSFYGLSAHYILSLVHYCAATGKRSMAYAERVAVSWINDGVDESGVDSHIDKLYKRRSNEGLVRGAFGISDRSLTSREKEYIAAWFDKFGADIDMIRLAYEITVDRTGKAAFGYINKILASWSEKGITTLSDAKKEASSPAARAARASDEIDLEVIEQFMKS